ncbi:MAG TPA: universal stress protein [Candidatus Binatia bacterium]|nr:universal stress protein [Candidatus Binatia bacterium]
MILVPFDGSAAAAHALEYACDFGKLVGADVHVCHVVDYVEDAEGVLAKARDIARKHEVSIQAQTLRGNVAEAILACARESRADLIVMGTHGRGGFRWAMLGSVAEDVTRHSTLPVLLLRDPTYELAPVTA